MSGNIVQLKRYSGGSCNSTTASLPYFAASINTQSLSSNLYSCHLASDPVLQTLPVSEILEDHSSSDELLKLDTNTNYVKYTQNQYNGALLCSTCEKLSFDIMCLDLTQASMQIIGYNSSVYNVGQRICAQKSGISDTTGLYIQFNCQLANPSFQLYSDSACQSPSTLNQNLNDIQSTFGQLSYARPRLPWDDWTDQPPPNNSNIKISKSGFQGIAVVLTIVALILVLIVGGIFYYKKYVQRPRIQLAEDSEAQHIIEDYEDEQSDEQQNNKLQILEVQDAESRTT